MQFQVCERRFLSPRGTVHDAPSIVIGNFRKNMLIHPSEHRGYRTPRRSASFCGALVTTSKTSSGIRTGGVAGHDGGHTAGCVRDAAPRAAQGERWTGTRRSMKCMGRRRKGRTLRTTIRGATARCTGPWRRPAMCCICAGRLSAHQLRDQGSAAGIERVSKHFREVRMRADSGYYSQALVKICEQREVEFFIVAKQHRNLMNAVREIQDSNWKSFAGRTYRQTLGAGGGAGGERT